MSATRRACRAAARVVIAAAAAAIVGCSSGEDASPSTPATSTAAATSTTATSPSPAETSPAPGGATSVTDARGGLPTVEVRPVSFDVLDGLLPTLATSLTAATHVVELRLRTLEVSVDAGTLCVGGGAGLQRDTCSPLAQRPGVLVYSDDAETPVYAVLTSDQVAVVFERPGGGLTCFNEPASTVGPVVLWWCEDQFPPLIRFELASGPRFEVLVG